MIKQLKAKTFLFLWIISHSAQAVDPKLSKYCLPDTDGKSEAEIQINGGSPSIYCLKGIMSSQAIYETINIANKKSSNVVFDNSYFLSPEWEKTLTSLALMASNNQNCTSVEKNKQTNKIEMICGDEKKDITDQYLKLKNKVESGYAEGAKKYAEDTEKTKLTDFYAAKVPEQGNRFSPTNPQNAFEPWTPFKVELLESLMNGKAVTLKSNDKIPGWHMWQPNPSLNDLKINIPNPSGFKSILLTNENKNTIEADSKIKVIPLIRIKENNETITKVAPTEDLKCQDALTAEITALLAHDKKNVIGMQFELTVLRLAAAATKEGVKTFEDLIKTQNKKIAAADDGKIDEMIAMYKTHGFDKDKKTLSNLLKDPKNKSVSYAKDKRFFNEESSAFLLAYQKLNTNTEIKDADISVLWFMDKVSESAKEQSGAFTSLHNRTNLSTRIAQYTGYMKSTKALDADKLSEMANLQRGKIEVEFLAIVKAFQSKNSDCYNKLFGEGVKPEDCKAMEIMDANFSQLLAIQSKIPLGDQVSLDENLKGNLGAAKFSIRSFVNSTEELKENTKPVVNGKPATVQSVVANAEVKEAKEEQLVEIKIEDQPDPEK